MVFRNLTSAILLLPVLLFFSCQNNPAPEISGEETDTVRYSFHAVSRELECAGKSAEPCLSINIMEISLEAGSADTVLKNMENSIREAVISTDNTPDKGSDPQALAGKLIKEYRRIITEIPDYDIPWSYERDIRVFLNRNGLFGVELSAYSFTGGAHGNYFTYYYLYNTVNGKRIHIEDLLRDGAIIRLTEMAENQFKQNLSLAGDVNYNDAGYWFEGNMFRLPDNFKYSEEGLELHYNTYEIAPYSEGEIILRFSLPEVNRLIKPEYRLNKKENNPV